MQSFLFCPSTWMLRQRPVRGIMLHLTPSGGQFLNFTTQCPSSFFPHISYSSFSFLLPSPAPPGDPSPPRCPSRQAWQTVGSRTSTLPPTARRTATMATRPTALRTGRTDSTAGQLHTLERQVGTQSVCV